MARCFLPQGDNRDPGRAAGRGHDTQPRRRQRIFLLGLVANLLSMLLLVLSQLAIGHGSLAYLILLLATTSLGLGFGLTVPALNTLAASFFPARVDSAVLILNALLGLGTALAPVFVALFTGLGFWWGLPLCVAILLAGLLAFSLRLPLQAGEGATGAAQERLALPRRFWIFAALRPALRHRRDDERQLGDALYDEISSEPRLPPLRSRSLSSGGW